MLLTSLDAAVHPALALSANPVRILAGVGLELGLALPASPAPRAWSEMTIRAA